MTQDWRCGTHNNPYNACWACMVESCADQRARERERALQDAVLAVRKVITGHSAVRKTVVEEAVELIESLMSNAASTRGVK